MATAKKLPSGSWRCLAYSHTERIYDEKTQKWKNKRIYESFTDNFHLAHGAVWLTATRNEYMMKRPRNGRTKGSMNLLPMTIPVRQDGNGLNWLLHSFRRPKHLTRSGNGRIMESSHYPRQSTNILNPERT